jgi:hypothetical protein
LTETPVSLGWRNADIEPKSEACELIEFDREHLLELLQTHSELSDCVFLTAQEFLTIQDYL